MIGLIPAAGTAERWGGYLKELLPIGEGNWLIDNCIRTLENAGCTKFIVITNADKIDAVARHIAKHNPTIHVTYVLGGATMWESILKALPYCTNRRVIMAMPDTVVDLVEPDKLLLSPITFGVFSTDDPARYSVFLDTRGAFKKDASLPKQTYLAWGIVSWSAGITHIFLRETFPDFDTAFSYAMEYAGYSFTPIRAYHDMATFDEYARFVGMSV